MRTIRGGSGLGDAIYVASVVRHLNLRGERLRVATDWPDVFRYLDVECIQFTRNGIDILAHYSARKPQPTKQFVDVCQTAGIREPVELKLEWRTERRLSTALPVVLVQLPRSPMGRTDGFGAALLPDCRVIQRAIDLLNGRAYIVQVGSGKALHRFTGIDLDLSNKTSVVELIDLAAGCDAFLGYVSFIVPLAESLNKPALLVWSRKGLNSGTAYIRQITPQKVLYRDSSHYVVDDDPSALEQKVELLLRPREGLDVPDREAGCDRRERAGVA
jgi:hypothetical protein